MQRKDIGLSNPVDMIYYIQPFMMFALFPLAFWLEILPFLQGDLFPKVFDRLDIFWEKAAYVFIGAVLAFLLELSEYLLLSFTSSLTLSIAGIFKEIFTLFLAFEYSGDRMSLVNFCGLLLCLVGITVHVVQKSLDVTGKVRVLHFMHIQPNNVISFSIEFHGPKQKPKRFEPEFGKLLDEDVPYEQKELDAFVN